MKTQTFITLPEIHTARKFIITQIQLRAFRDDLIALQTKRHVNKNSKIKALNPFIDVDGLLRVGGRLSKASIPYDQMHPIILPHAGNCIRDAHLRTLHGGKQATLSHTLFQSIHCSICLSSY